MDTPLWLQICEPKLTQIVFFAVFLMLIILVMLFKDRLSKKRGRLRVIRYGILAISFGYVGLILKAQPTLTNIIIFHNALGGLQFPYGLYLMEPFIFLSFSFIILTLVLWGRGVFCGWLCPYGALVELLSKFYTRLFPAKTWNLSERVHSKLIYLKYVFLFVILGAALYNFMLAEYLSEVEPFRTLVLRWNREWYFLLYFFILTVGSAVIYRAFCRYLCPLGAAFAIPLLLKRIPLIKMKRYDFCKTCNICAKDCAPQAVMSNGSIDSRECLNCQDCQVNFFDEDKCPVLIRRKKGVVRRLPGISEPMEEKRMRQVARL